MRTSMGVVDASCVHLRFSETTSRSNRSDSLATKVVRLGRRSCNEYGLRILAPYFLTFIALLFTGFVTRVSAQDAKQAPPPTAPSPGKALVYIYRVGSFVGSAAHDHLYVNGVYLAYLKNSEYAGMEVDPGMVVVTGLPEMYTVDVFTAAGAAVNDVTRKESERIRFVAEEGKTYYLKWTSSTMATGIKVTQMDPAVGAKEMKKLHLSKPVEQPNTTKTEKPKSVP